MSKTLNTRIQQKHDFEVNWNQIAKTFIPYSGEAIIYDPEVDANGNFLTINGKTASLPSGRTEGYTTSRMKIGDGTSTLANLHYVAFTTEVKNEVISTVPSVSGSLTYNGTMQTPSWNNYDTSKLILAGDTCGQDAGTYRASFIPQKGYQWSDGTITAKTVNWTIAKASRTISVSSSEVTLGYTTSAISVSISYPGKGTVTMSVDKPSIVTATLANNVINLVHNNYATGTATISLALSGDNNYSNATKTITVNIEVANPILEKNSWATISKISDASQGSNYWSVGDTKKIIINGTVGTLSINNYETYVYILGFDHSNGEGGIDKGIHFGGFKTAASEGIDVCLIDSRNGLEGESGTKYFTMNHSIGETFDEWAGCDLRYDILGSTDVEPLGYNTTMTTTKLGYDATSTCATNPVSNTLMAALPQDLRVVMKPMIKYTYSKKSNPVFVDGIVDYLPLLAEYEVFGTTYANIYEWVGQSQYAYFAASNSRVKYKHSETSSPTRWWLRSPNYHSSTNFCIVDSSGISGTLNSTISLGVAPVFKV